MVWLMMEDRRKRVGSKRKWTGPHFVAMQDGVLLVFNVAGDLDASQLMLSDQNDDQSTTATTNSSSDNTHNNNNNNDDDDDDEDDGKDYDHNDVDDHNDNKIDSNGKSNSRKRHKSKGQRKEQDKVKGKVKVKRRARRALRLDMPVRSPPFAAEPATDVHGIGQRAFTVRFNNQEHAHIATRQFSLVAASKRERDQWVEAMRAVSHGTEWPPRSGPRRSERSGTQVTGMHPATSRATTTTITTTTTTTTATHDGEHKGWDQEEDRGTRGNLTDFDEDAAVDNEEDATGVASLPNSEDNLDRSCPSRHRNDRDVSDVESERSFPVPGPQDSVHLSGRRLRVVKEGVLLLSPTTRYSRDDQVGVRAPELGPPLPTPPTPPTPSTDIAAQQPVVAAQTLNTQTPSQSPAQTQAHSQVREATVQMPPRSPASPSKTTEANLRTHPETLHALGGDGGGDEGAAGAGAGAGAGAAAGARPVGAAWAANTSTIAPSASRVKKTQRVTSSWQLRYVRLLSSGRLQCVDANIICVVSLLHARVLKEQDPSPASSFDLSNWDVHAFSVDSDSISGVDALGSNPWVQLAISAAAQRRMALSFSLPRSIVGGGGGGGDNGASGGGSGGGGGDSGGGGDNGGGAANGSHVKKLSKSKSCVLGARSKHARDMMAARVQEYADWYEDEHERKRRRRQECAQVVAKAWMYKKGPKAFSRWKRRFFVMLSTRELVYYESDVNGKVKGAIDLTHVLPTDVRMRDNIRDAPAARVLEIITHKRSWLLVAGDLSEVELGRWLDLVRRKDEFFYQFHSPRTGAGVGNSLGRSLSMRKLGLNGKAKRLRFESTDDENDRATRPPPDPSPDLRGYSYGENQDLSNNEEDEGDDDGNSSCNESTGNGKQTRANSAQSNVASGPVGNDHGSNYNNSNKNNNINSTDVADNDNVIDKGHAKLEGSQRSLSDKIHILSPSLTTIASKKEDHGSTMVDRDGTAQDYSADVGRDGGPITSSTSTRRSSYHKVLERSLWACISGNVPVECLSLSPYSGRVLAEALTGHSRSTATTSGSPQVSRPSADVAPQGPFTAPTLAPALPSSVGSSTGNGAIFNFLAKSASVFSRLSFLWGDKS